MQPAVIQQCDGAEKTKAFLCLNLRNHTHHLSFLCKLPARTLAHTHCRHYPRRLAALLIFQQEEEELWEDRDLAKTHTSARTANTVKIFFPTSLLKTDLRSGTHTTTFQLLFFFFFFLALVDSIINVCVCVESSSCKAFSFLMQMGIIRKIHKNSHMAATTSNHFLKRLCII